MIIINEDNATRIRQLNDTLRIAGVGGAVVVTAGIAALDIGHRRQVLDAVREFSAFTADNDPHGEHDCASFEVAGQRYLWKIDYYSEDMASYSADPADPAITRRVLTVMRAEEY